MVSSESIIISLYSVNPGKIAGIAVYHLELNYSSSKFICVSVFICVCVMCWVNC